ncbi:MAG: UPF0175 family protein, partial [Thermoguttaceae bacterium]
MKTFEIKVKLPDNSELDEKNVKMLVAAMLFDRGEISSGWAADIAGISKRDFLETVGKYGV